MVPVSPGELLDRISILEIKSERMKEPAQLAHVREELALLCEARDRSIGDIGRAQTLQAELKAVNRRLWEIEDDIRAKERAGEFDEDFVELARSVYFNNDRRSEIKRELNRQLGSRIVEQKSYTAY
jgi:hypothetical protein